MPCDTGATWNDGPDKTGRACAVDNDPNINAAAAGFDIMVCRSCCVEWTIELVSTGLESAGLTWNDVTDDGWLHEPEDITFDVENLTRPGDICVIK